MRLATTSCTVKQLIRSSVELVACRAGETSRFQEAALGRSKGSSRFSGVAVKAVPLVS